MKPIEFSLVNFFILKTLFLKDPIVKLMYESSILKNKPKQGKKKIKEMLPVDEGGFSYW